MMRQILPLMLSIFMLAPISRADTLSVSFTDPLGDQSIPTFIDVSSAVLTFDQCSGEYSLDISASPANPFLGEFRVNVFLFNGDRGPSQDPSFFADSLNDFDLMNPTALITLTGINPRLVAWQAGDQVAANTTGLLGNPDGVASFTSAVNSLPFAASDTIAQNTVETVTLHAAQACPAPQISVSKTDQLVADSDGVLGPGDTLKYTVVIANSAAVLASGAIYTAPQVSGAALQPGSVTTTAGTVTMGNAPGDAMVSVDIGPIAGPSGSVTIMYQLTVDDPLPAGLLQLSCQGTLSGSNFSSVLSDDPETPTAADPTSTAIGLTMGMPVQEVPALSRPGLLALLLLLAACGAQRLFLSH